MRHVLRRTAPPACSASWRSTLACTCQSVMTTSSCEMRACYSACTCAAPAYRQEVLLVADVLVGASLAEEVDNLHVPAHGGPVQRRVIALRRGVEPSDDNDARQNTEESARCAPLNERTRSTVFRSAPCSTRYMTVCRWPLCAARSRGVSFIC